MLASKLLYACLSLSECWDVRCVPPGWLPTLNSWFALVVSAAITTILKFCPSLFSVLSCLLPCVFWVAYFSKSHFFYWLVLYVPKNKMSLDQDCAEFTVGLTLPSFYNSFPESHSLLWWQLASNLCISMCTAKQNHSLQLTSSFNLILSAACRNFYQNSFAVS